MKEKCQNSSLSHSIHSFLLLDPHFLYSSSLATSTSSSAVCANKVCSSFHDGCRLIWCMKQKRKEIKEEKGGDGATIHTIFHEIMFNCLTSQQETFFSSMLVHPFSFLSSLFFYSYMLSSIKQCGQHIMRVYMSVIFPLLIYQA